MASIYIHTNRVNGKVYVGQTWQKPEDRWRMQMRDALMGNRDCRYFSAAICKYGWDSFDHQVVAEVDTQAELDNLEKIWIILLQARNPKFGYNLQVGGSKGRQSEETKKIISDYQKTHDNAGRFRAGETPIVHYEKGHVPWNKGKLFRHVRSFSVGHAPYCNHLGGFNLGPLCSRCGKEKAQCA